VRDLLPFREVDLSIILKFRNAEKFWKTTMNNKTNTVAKYANCDALNRDIANTFKTISRLIENGQLHFSSRDEVAVSFTRTGPAKDFTRAIGSLKTFVKGARSAGITAFQSKLGSGEKAKIETANMAVYFTRQQI